MGIQVSRLFYRFETLNLAGNEMPVKFVLMSFAFFIFHNGGYKVTKPDLPKKDVHTKFGRRGQNGTFDITGNTFDYF